MNPAQSSSFRRALLSCLALSLLACGPAEEASRSPQAPDDTLGTTSGLSWEAFQQRIFVEPGTGVVIADGDTPFFASSSCASSMS